MPLLLQKICEKQQIVTDYEAGRGIPNNLILGKMERVIGIKLRGKERGQPLVPPVKKWESATAANGAAITAAAKSGKNAKLSGGCQNKKH